jgi:tetratricopeptide (TPR) repeat protein
VAERVGAGLLLLGDVAGRGDSVVLGAALVRVRDGRAGPQARVAGPADSLPRLVERLAATLLATQAGEGERARSLAATPLPALRAYLAGQSLYRRSRYRESAREFERALSFDSGFALAGVGLAGAASWFGEPGQLQRGLEVAWRGRDRLSARDRALLDARGGPSFPRVPAQGELAAAKLRYARVAPERPEAWFEAGDALFHFGALLGEPDADERAAEAFERALSLDSTYAPALEHLVFLAARARDTTAVRRWASLYLAADSVGENADGVRWRVAVATNDRRVVDGLARRADALSEVTAHTIDEISQLDGVGLDGAAAIMTAHMRAHRHTPIERQSYTLSAHDLALNRGHPRRALALTDSMRAAGVSEIGVLQTRVVDAVFGDGDTVAAAAAARALAPRAYAPPPAALADRLPQEFALCAVELWRVSRGDTATVRRSVARLREPYRGPLPPGMTSPTRPAFGCALMLEAAVAAAAPAPGAHARRVAGRLDSLLRTGPNGLAQLGGNLVAARLHERLGDVPGALAAVRRREYFFGRTAFLSTYLREEARLAERAGDLRGAAEAARHYAALRAGAEPGLQDIAPRGIVDVDPPDRGRSDQ